MCPSICKSGSSERKPPKIAKKDNLNSEKSLHSHLLVHNWSFFNQFQKTIGVLESEKQALFNGPVPVVLA